MFIIGIMEVNYIMISKTDNKESANPIKYLLGDCLWPLIHIKVKQELDLSGEPCQREISALEMASRGILENFGFDPREWNEDAMV